MNTETKNHQGTPQKIEKNCESPNNDASKTKSAKSLSNQEIRCEEKFNSENAHNRRGNSAPTDQQGVKREICSKRQVVIQTQKRRERKENVGRKSGREEES